MRIPDPIADNAKAVIGAVGLFTSAANEALADNVLDLDEIGTLTSRLLGIGVAVYLIWRVPNRQHNHGEAPAK